MFAPRWKTWPALRFQACLVAQISLPQKSRRDMPRRRVDRQRLGPPAQHAAGQVGHLREPRLLQQHRRLCRPCARAAHRHDGAVAFDLAGTPGQFRQRQQAGTADVAECVGVFTGLAHVDHLDVVGTAAGDAFFQHRGLDLPDATEAEGQRRPGRFLRQRRAAVGLAAAQVGGHRDVHQLGMRQAQVVHVAGEVGHVCVAAQARVVALLFGHAGDGEAAVVVCRVEQAGRRQRQDLFPHRAEQRAGAALLEVGAPATADQQAVAGEGHALVVEHEAHAAAGVARSGPRFEAAAAEGDAVTVVQQPVGVLRGRRLGQHDLAAAAQLQQPGAGDMVGVDVGVQRGQQAQAEFAQQRSVAAHVLEHRVDEHGLAGIGVAEQVGVGRRRRIEELAEDEHAKPLLLELRAGMAGPGAGRVSAARTGDRAPPCRPAWR
jgi:hypothetical protein